MHFSRNQFLFCSLTAVTLQLFLSCNAGAEQTSSCGELVRAKCLACHYETRICRKVANREGERSWKSTIKNMIRKGAEVNDEELKRLITCLSAPHPDVAELCGRK